MKYNRKQTKLWTTAEGKRVRICDMSDNHLLNTISMLERIAAVKTSQEIDAGYSVLSSLRGEMATYYVEQDLERLSEEGIAPNEIFPIYNSLLLEQLRRNL